MRSCPTCGQPVPAKGEDRAAEVRAVFDHYRTLHPRAHRNPVPTSKEWRHIRARLVEGFSVDELCAAIDGMHRTPHNLGMNDRGQQYLGLELCMRSGDQVTRFIEAPATQAAPLSKASATTAMGVQGTLESWGERLAQQGDAAIGPAVRPGRLLKGG